MTNSIVLAYVFRFKDQAQTMAEAGDAPAESVGEGAAAARNKYRQILGIGAVHWLSLFALIYVGVEVTLGGTCSSW